MGAFTHTHTNAHSNCRNWRLGQLNSRQGPWEELKKQWKKSLAAFPWFVLGFFIMPSLFPKHPKQRGRGKAEGSLKAKTRHWS